jgi:predicted DNA-binding protein (MmcQ/YjbR family)
MNNLIEQEIFENKKVNFNALESYGFIKENDYYVYSKLLSNNQFKAVIKIDKKGRIIGDIYDIEYNDLYEAYRRTFGLGEFASSIKEEYVLVLEDIKKNCFVDSLFSSPQAERINNYIFEKYNDKPEFPFEDEGNKDACIYRNKDTQKWYSIIMRVLRNKVDKSSSALEMIYCMNLRVIEGEAKELIGRKGFYECYHMNKKLWISIILDDTLEDEIIFKYIDQSYNFFKRNDKWIVPARADYFDLTTYFNNPRKENVWKMYKGAKVGDTMYLYASNPYSCIMYKTVVTQVNIPSKYKKSNGEYMELILVKVIEKYPYEKYTLKTISKYGIKTVRGPRSMPEELLSFMNEK